MPKIITYEVYKKLKEELERLKTVERKLIAEKIKIAKEFGDLSENSEYQTALEEQKRLEKRILELENLLKSAKIIKKTDKKGKNEVSIGSEVVLIDLGNKKTLNFKIVGFGEANPLENKISPESPLGKVLLGKKVGEIIEVDLGNTKKKLKIKKIL
ncbi:MAG: transcription elongation factor GreA [Candidatus Aenigmatarchaeota archaeon]